MNHKLNTNNNGICVNWLGLIKQREVWSNNCYKIIMETLKGYWFSSSECIDGQIGFPKLISEPYASKIPIGDMTILSILIKKYCVEFSIKLSSFYSK